MVNLVGKLADEKQPAAILGLNAIATGGIWNDRRIKPRALVFNTDSDERVVDVHGDLDTFGRVEFVAVHDGVRQRLTECHPYLESRRARRDTTRHAVTCNEIYSFFDNVEIGGHPKADFDPASHRSRHPRLTAPNEEPERSGGDLRIQRSLPPWTL